MEMGRAPWELPLGTRKSLNEPDPLKPCMATEGRVNEAPPTAPKPSSSAVVRKERRLGLDAAGLPAKERGQALVALSSNMMAVGGQKAGQVANSRWVTCGGAQLGKT